MAKAKAKGRDPLTRAIVSRERGIERMRGNIRRLQHIHQKEVAEIWRRIGEKQVLLDALRRGTLKK